VYVLAGVSLCNKSSKITHIISVVNFCVIKQQQDNSSGLYLLVFVYN
jgi:hypothetical protein